MGKYTHLTVHTDGASRRNPGPAASGICIADGTTSQAIAKFGFTLGNATNNEAEYQALLQALEWLLARKELFADTLHVDFYLDSQLVESQVKGAYKAKKPELRRLAEEVRERLRQLPGTHALTLISRSENTCADRIANETLDRSTPDSH